MVKLTWETGCAVGCTTAICVASAHRMGSGDDAARMRESGAFSSVSKMVTAVFSTARENGPDFLVGCQTHKLLGLKGMIFATCLPKGLRKNK